jgi:hypothetical protein
MEFQKNVEYGRLHQGKYQPINSQKIGWKRPQSHLHQVLVQQKEFFEQNLADVKAVLSSQFPKNSQEEETLFKTDQDVFKHTQLDSNEEMTEPELISTQSSTPVVSFEFNMAILLPDHFWKQFGQPCGEHVCSIIS